MPGSPIATSLRWALLAVCLIYVAMYCTIAIARMPYPFELEWMEGGSVDHVRRILDGKKLYAEPSLEFAAYIYTPLYFYLCAAAAKVMGLGFFPLRFVSYLSSLGCFAAIFWIVRTETRNNVAGFLASSLFAATFRIGGAWFDIARVDTLFLFLLLASLYWVRFGKTMQASVLAGALLGLSFLTKQTALFVALPVFVYALYADRKRGFVFCATFAAIAGLSTLVLNLIHDGWYWYYLFYLPRRHEMGPVSLRAFWFGDLARPLPVASLLAGVFLFARFYRKDRTAVSFYFLTGSGMCVSSWVSRLHTGGYDNVFMPAFAAMSILFGLGVHEVLRILSKGPRKQHRLWEACLYAACLLQFDMLRYNPLRQIPTPDDLAGGRAIVKEIEAIEGDVLVLYHGYLARLAGKSGFSPGLALHVFLDEGAPATDRFTGDIRKAVEDRRFGAIILDEPWTYSDWFVEIMEEEYVLSGPLEQQANFYPVTGGGTRPRLIYVPRERTPDLEEPILPPIN